VDTIKLQIMGNGTVTISIERFKELEMKENILQENDSVIYSYGFGLNYKVTLRGTDQEVLEELKRELAKLDVIKNQCDMIHRDYDMLHKEYLILKYHWLVRLLGLSK